MKTIGYRDLTDQRGIVYCYESPENSLSWLFNQKRHERISKALREIKHLGNCEVVLIKGNKTRHLFYRGI